MAHSAFFLVVSNRFSVRGDRVSSAHACSLISPIYGLHATWTPHTGNPFFVPSLPLWVSQREALFVICWAAWTELVTQSRVLKHRPMWRKKTSRHFFHQIHLTGEMGKKCKLWLYYNLKVLQVTTEYNVHSDCALMLLILVALSFCLLLLKFNMFCVQRWIDSKLSCVSRARGARVSVTKRLGRKINSTGKLVLLLQLSDAIVNNSVEITSLLLVVDIDLRSAEDVPLKRSLAKRLGRVMDMDQTFMPPQKGKYYKTSKLAHEYSASTSCGLFLCLHYGAVHNQQNEDLSIFCFFSFKTCKGKTRIALWSWHSWAWTWGHKCGRN